MKKRGVKQIVIDGHKGCSRCLEIKPISEFCKNSRVQSGLHSYCNSCKTILYLELKSRKLNGENFVTEKKCKICDEVKPRESFTVCASTDGLFPYCKTCYNKIISLFLKICCNPCSKTNRVKNTCFEHT